MKAGPMRGALSLLLVGAACAFTPKQPASPEDAAEQLRRMIAKAPDDMHRPMLLEELAKVEFERARLSNTVLAYRRFLAEFPNSDEASTARVLLEEIRFQEAGKMGTHAAWEDFLEEHPRGKHAGVAREQLGTLEIADAMSSADIVVVRRTLARFPEHSRHDALAAHEDDLAWKEASFGGIDAIDAYLTAHPNGTHRIDASGRRDGLEQQEILDSEDLARAELRARAADATERRRATVLTLKLARALASLNLDDVKAVATTQTTEPAVLAVRQRAVGFLDSLTAKPFSDATRALLADARAGSGLPSHDEVVARVSTGDPLNQVAALHELAEFASPGDVDVALKVLGSHYVAVQLAAVECLRSLATSLKPAVWQSIARTREEDAIARAADDTWLRVAALRDASGRTTQALDAWRQQMLSAPDSLLGTVRSFALLQAANDRLASGVAARDLVKAAIAYGEQHVPVASDPRHPPPDEGRGEVIGVSGELTASRQICAAITLATQGSTALGGLVATAAAGEGDLIQLAKTDADAGIARLKGRQLELEQGLIRKGLHFAPCDSEPAAGIITASRARRVQAISQLGRSGDSRLLPLIESLEFTPASEVRNAAAKAAALLAAVHAP